MLFISLLLLLLLRLCCCLFIYFIPSFSHSHRSHSTLSTNPLYTHSTAQHTKRAKHLVKLILRIKCDGPYFVVLCYADSIIIKSAVIKFNANPDIFDLAELEYACERALQRPYTILYTRSFTIHILPKRNKLISIFMIFRILFTKHTHIDITS